MQKYASYCREAMAGDVNGCRMVGEVKGDSEGG